MATIDVEKMLSATIGVEVEFFGMTRAKAIEVVENVLGGSRVMNDDGTCYHSYVTRDSLGRKWTVMRDGSVHDGDSQSCELVTPVLVYRKKMEIAGGEISSDIETLQKIIRALRKAGGRTDEHCGIHVHVSGEGHDARSLRNWVNIIASKQELFCKALNILPGRQTYCQKFGSKFIEKLNRRRPTTVSGVEDIWYESLGPSFRTRHYNNSRYHLLNLHSYFNSDHHTVEVRAFNSELHAGKLRAYIVLVLALNYQALTAHSVSAKPVQDENEKFAMRVYLNRIGFIGDEFKNCREHLLAHLEGNSAWRYGRPA